MAAPGRVRPRALAGPCATRWGRVLGVLALCCSLSLSASAPAVAPPSEHPETAALTGDGWDLASEKGVSAASTESRLAKSDPFADEDALEGADENLDES